MSRMKFVLLIKLILLMSETHVLVSLRLPVYFAYCIIMSQYGKQQSDMY